MPASSMIAVNGIDLFLREDRSQLAADGALAGRADRQPSAFTALA